MKMDGTYPRDHFPRAKMIPIPAGEAYEKILQSYGPDADPSQFLNKGFVEIGRGDGIVTILNRHDAGWYLWDIPATEYDARQRF